MTLESGRQYHGSCNLRCDDRRFGCGILFSYQAGKEAALKVVKDQAHDNGLNAMDGGKGPEFPCLHHGQAIYTPG